MGFFDLNIPYDSSQSSKTTRIKLVVKSMELGYSGIAYNRTIKGVMSDRDRCSIPLFSHSSILNVAPSLASSVNLHRDLLGIPRASAFRQYTRLTVCVDSPSQGQVLNSGNPILNSYDLVAVRPLNQTAFDHACEKAEVDIIAVDFSEKLPFRLKLPMVKAAMERGVCFEITYSDLIADVQVRRQMISNAKLLVDWTRGRNLIFSSAAPSVTELRGPYDVANLSSLLGLSMERAKAAISKNCRNLIANALRKKHFYKEAIRVELISSDDKGPMSVDWLKWDSISSGEGDLELDDIAKSFCAATRVSKTVKAIDFAAVIGSTPSFGENFYPVTKATEAPVATIGVSENPGMHDLPSSTDQTSSYNILSENQTSGHESSQELHLPIDATNAFTNSEEIRMPMNTTEEEPKKQNCSDVLFNLIETKKQDLQSQEHNPSCELNVMLPKNGTCQTFAMEKLNAACVSDSKVSISSGNINVHAQIENSMSSQVSDVVLGAQDVVMDEAIRGIDIKDHQDTSVTKNVSGREQLLESGDDTMALVMENVSGREKLQESGDDTIALVTENVSRRELQESGNDTIALVTENVSRRELQESGNDMVTVVDHSPFLVTSNDLKIKGVFSVANCETSDKVAMGEQEHGDADTDNLLVLDDDLKVKDNSSVTNCVSLEEVTMKEVKNEEPDSISDLKNEEADSGSDYPIAAPSISGKFRAKKRRPHRPLLFPFKRLLNPMHFKKKAKKFKARMKVV